MVQTYRRIIFDDLSSCSQTGITVKTNWNCHLVDNLSPGSNVGCGMTKLPWVVSIGDAAAVGLSFQASKPAHRWPNFDIKTTGSCFANQMFHERRTKSFCTASSFHHLHLDSRDCVERMAVTVEVRSAAKASVACSVGRSSRPCRWSCPH